MKLDSVSIKRKVLEIHTKFIVMKERDLALYGPRTFIYNKLKIIFMIESKNKEVGAPEWYRPGCVSLVESYCFNQFWVTSVDWDESFPNKGMLPVLSFLV